jgi:cytochrome P450
MLVGTPRKVMRPFKFSNGITLHPGEIVASPIFAIHTDPKLYENPEKFDAFRFSNLAERMGQDGRHYATTTSTKYLIFGHGDHAW